MAEMITELTPEQEAMLPKQAEKWIAIGLSTERADRPRAENGVRLAYEAAGLTAPELMVWVESPYQGVIAQATIPTMLEGAGGDAAAVQAQVEGVTWADREVADQRMLASWDAGLIWPGWAETYGSWFETMRMIGVEGLEPFIGHEEVAQSAYMWWAFDTFVVICERPREIHRDAENRLHAEGRPAMLWPDGWGFNVWHGTRVPIDFFDWDAVRVLSERNDEVRRAGIERIGWHEFLAGLELIAEADDPGNEGMRLQLFDLDSEAGRRLLGEDAEWETLPRLIVMDNASLDRGGHRRRYSRLVPAETVDPVAGIAVSYGLTRDEYAGIEAAR